MAAAGLSSRNPRNTAWRTLPSFVHSAKETSATSVGLTQCTLRGMERGWANGLSWVRKAPSRRKLKTGGQFRAASVGQHQRQLLRTGVAGDAGKLLPVQQHCAA